MEEQEQMHEEGQYSNFNEYSQGIEDVQNNECY